MALFFIKAMSSNILYFNTLPSTNTKAYELAQLGAVHGQVVWAKSQSAGKGRLGKKWMSTTDRGLYFTIILRPNLDLEEYPKLTMTAGHAIAEALERMCGVEVGLKWPNDVYISGRKCCGILAEASLGSGWSEPFAVIGVGINVLSEKDDFPKDLRDTATSLRIETGKSFSMEELLHKCHKQILECLKEHEELGFPSILHKWKLRDFLRGKTMQWLTSAGKVVSGVALGPDAKGRMLVRDQAGVIHEVLSGDISLIDK